MQVCHQLDHSLLKWKKYSLLTFILNPANARWRSLECFRVAALKAYVNSSQSKTVNLGYDRLAFCCCIKEWQTFEDLLINTAGLKRHLALFRWRFVEDFWSMVKVVCMFKLLKQPVSQYVSFLSMFVLGRHGSRLLSARIFDIMLANSVPTQHFDVYNHIIPCSHWLLHITIHSIWVQSLCSSIV